MWPIKDDAFMAHPVHNNDMRDCITVTIEFTKSYPLKPKILFRISYIDPLVRERLL